MILQNQYKKTSGGPATGHPWAIELRGRLRHSTGFAIFLFADTGELPTIGEGCSGNFFGRGEGCRIRIPPADPHRFTAPSGGEEEIFSSNGLRREPSGPRCESFIYSAIVRIRRKEEDRRIDLLPYPPCSPDPVNFSQESDLPEDEISSSRASEGTGSRTWIPGKGQKLS
jgi:hypothetical protein